MKKEKIIIVDAADNVIGAKYRDEIDYSKDIYRCTGIWITNSKNQILIAQRKMTKKHDPGKWGPAVAGTVEDGETYEQNAYKELEEEIGVTGISLQLSTKLYNDSSKKYFGQWFFCVIDKSIDEFKIQADEVERLMWIEKGDLMRDVVANPEKYIPSFPRRLESLV